MRTDGTVVAGGVVSTDRALGLPMEEREDRDAVRARREAKREQLRTRSPFAGLAATKADAHASQYAATRDDSEALAAEKFTTPDLEPVAHVVEPLPDVVEPVADVVEPTADVDVSPAPSFEVFERSAAAPTPKPVPRPRPVAKPTVRTQAHVDAAAIVRDYVEDGLTVPEIAQRRGHVNATVRRVLQNTPGVVMRDDRKTRSGSEKKEYDPEFVAAVRALYTGPEQLTQVKVAERLGTSARVVQRVMERYEIPARPPANERDSSTMAHTTPTELMTQRLADAGVTSKDVRAWAAEHDLACPAVGFVPLRLLGAYLRADGGAPVEPDATDLALTHPEPAPPALAADDDERSCASCLDRVGHLSSRDWCDACELDEANASTPQPPRVPDGLARDLVAAGDVLRGAAAVGLGPVLRAAGDLLHAVADLVAPTQADYALAADGDA